MVLESHPRPRFRTIVVSHLETYAIEYWGEHGLHFLLDTFRSSSEANRGADAFLLQFLRSNLCRFKWKHRFVRSINIKTNHLKDVYSNHSPFPDQNAPPKTHIQEQEANLQLFQQSFIFQHHAFQQRKPLLNKPHPTM